VFLVSSQILIFSSPVSATIQEEDISVEWGDNVYQNLPYLYAGTFYDDADFTFAWTTAKIQFEYIPDSSVAYEHSITELDNNEIQYPTNSSFSMVNGTHHQNGTLNAVDDDYHAFDSTYDRVIAEKPDDFTIANGTSDFEGDLEIIDSNYTTFYSEEDEHYSGTYSFINETDGTYGTNIDFVDSADIDADCNATIISEVGSHRKVLNLSDDSNAGKVYVYNTAFDQVSGTVEFWWRQSANDKISIFYLYDDGIGTALAFYMRDTGQFSWYDGAYHDVKAYSGDTWYHNRIVFDCEAGTNGQFTWSIDGIAEASNIEFRDDCDSLDKLLLGTSANDMGYQTYIDAVGYSWDTNYTIGDNLYCLQELKFTIQMNLDYFSNLNETYLVYAYLTNISQICNYSIYNFNSSSYDVIENDINLAFVNSYFLLNSSYYNATNDLILSFEMSDYTSEFRLELERLLVRKPSYLNFSTTVNFDTITNLLQMDINSYQRSNITQLINMSIWNSTTSSWDYLDGASYTTTFQLLQWINATFSGYVDTNGDVLLMYNGVNIMDAFRFELDALSIKIWRKTIVQYEKTLSLLETWKYRFVLDDGLGTQHIVDWIYFNVIEQRPNFEGISESRYSTQWVLTSTATSGDKYIVYQDQLTSESWVLSDYGTSVIQNSYIPQHDSWVESLNPDTNHGSDPDGEVYYWGGTTPDRIRWNYFGITSNPTYLLENTAGISTSLLKMYSFTGSVGLAMDFFETGSFLENEITWTNKPALGVELASSVPVVVPGYTVFDLGSYDIYGYWAVTPDGYYEAATGVQTRASEYWETSKRPTLYFEANKHYHTTAGEGYTYMQTNTVETLGLLSPVSSSRSLSEGDIFTVDLETTSDNALLKLYSGSVLQQTLNLLVGNTRTSRQTVEIVASADILFDQVKITSELTDTEYFKLYDIKAEHWVFEDEEDQRSMYVNPYGQNDLIANLGNNSLKIYEDNMLRTDTYVTISYDLLTHIFESTIPETVFVSFYDSNNDYLDFNQFTTYVNYTLYGADYGDQRLTSREFYVDEKSTIYFNVYDSFEVSIYNKSRLAKTFIDITLNVYTLKIKNEALDDASYTLTKGSVSKDGILFPDDIDEYQIASGNYTFSYIKGSDSEVSVNFDLTQNRLLKINRSRMCYLTYSNQRGEHLFFDNYKTYLNGSLIYENIFYRDIGDIVGIEIKDRYDISIKNDTYTVVAGDNYIPITLTTYSLKVMNQQEIFNWINITRDPNYYESSMYWSEWIAPNEIIEFTLFAGYYKINLTDNENSGSSYYSYTLNGDDVLLISSGNTISNLIINIANVNTTIGNQITNVQIDLTNQNSNINNTIINIDINLSKLT
jgi:hypothetical protein